MKKVLGLALVTVLVLGTVLSSSAASYNWTSFDYPGADYTYPQAISGNNVVGNAGWFLGGASFIYDTSTGSFTTLSSPSGEPQIWEANGIDGNVVVGRTYDYTGFAYNIENSNWIAIDYSSVADNVDQTWAVGIDGSHILGSYSTTFEHGYDFIYDMGATDPWSILSYSADYTYPDDISGNYIVGGDDSGSNMRAYLFDRSTNTWTWLDNVIPFPTGTYWTTAEGIDGSRIVGYFDMDDNNNVFHELGYIYNMDTGEFTSLNYPGATSTQITGIDGDTIVGSFVDDSGTHGFVASPVPLPSPLFLLGSGLLGIIGLRRRKRLRASS